MYGGTSFNKKVKTRNFNNDEFKSWKFHNRDYIDPLKRNPSIPPLEMKLREKKKQVYYDENSNSNIETGSLDYPESKRVNDAEMF